MSDHTSLSTGAAWMQGQVMPLADARLPVNDWGLIHSDITYDVVPVWNGAFFRLGDYLDRFENSMRALRMDIGMDGSQIRRALSDMVAASGLKEAYVAMVASRGVPLIPERAIRGTAVIISMPGVFPTSTLCALNYRWISAPPGLRNR